jgi:hypothetical protein
MSIDLSLLTNPDLTNPPALDVSGTANTFDYGSLFPPPAPIDIGLAPAPVVDIPPYPQPIISIEPPPVIPYPPPVTVPLPQPGLPPIGYDPSGNPIYSVTGTLGQPSAPPPLPPGPVYAPPPTVVTQTSAGGTATATAIASINQQIQILSQDITPLVQGIQDALKQSAQTQADIAQNTANQISQAINGYSNGLFGWVQDLFTWLKKNIGDVIKGIASVLEKVGKAIFDAIKSVGQAVADWFTQTVGPVLAKIGDAIQKFSEYYQKHIEPILQSIASIQQVVSAAIVAVEKDLQAGLSGLLRLPTDIANALTGIDQALIRAGRALQVTQASDANFYYVTQDGHGFADHIKSLSDKISGKGVVPETTTYSPGTLNLNEPTLAQELPKLIDAMNAIFGDLVSGVRNIIGDPKKVMEAVGVGAAAFWFELLEPFEALVAIWEVMKAPLEIVGELAAERVREITQLTKLDPATLVQAWRRKFIDQAAMDDEMRVQGYNGNRSELLRRLSTHVEDVPTLIDFLYRGVVARSDFDSGLRDLGFTDAQIEAAVEGSTQLLDITTVLTAWRRGDVDEAQVDSVFAVNRWNDAERDLLKGLTFAPRNYAGAYGEYLVNRVLVDMNFPTPVFDTIPQAVRDAGRADGLSDGAILAQWTSQVNTLPAQAWLQLFWRGQASRTELDVVLERDRVPRLLNDNWIDSQRPLIPFRTIPGMIAAGIMTEAEGLDYLQRHGYSLADAVKLLEYAKRGSKNSKATTAQTQHDISLAQAKTAYQDGILTSDQYLTLLKTHGLDDNAATLEIELVNIAEETKARKQIGQDIINEYQAGLINQQEAFQQLAASGYTIAEQAAVQKKLQPAAVGKVKVPSEAELRAFASHNIITSDEYENRLITIGYTAQDAANFRQLHFPV